MCRHLAQLLEAAQHHLAQRPVVVAQHHLAQLREEVDQYHLAQRPVPQVPLAEHQVEVKVRVMDWAWYRLLAKVMRPAQGRAMETVMVVVVVRVAVRRRVLERERERGRELVCCC